ncbi:MAG: MarR family winged helix-turn-helix transcriptional regulator [Hyphomicrobiaceae bacterium]
MTQSSGKPRIQSQIRLASFLPFRLNRLASEVSRRISAIYGDRYGLDIPEWRVLATLSSRGTATAQAIVASTRTHKSTISRAVAALTQRGLIEREGSASDGREIVLRLSDKGDELMREIVPLVLAEERAMLNRLPAGQRREFLSALTRLEVSLELDEEEPL